MKTLVVISDTHGNMTSVERLDPVFSESDFIVHLGDTSGDGNRIRAKYPRKTVLLNGNCDFMRLGDNQRVIRVEGVNLFACHGDRFGVKSDRKRLAEAAAALGCTVALYGHTHVPLAEEIGGVTLLNPGALSRFGSGTYLYLVVNGEKIVYKIVTLST